MWSANQEMQFDLVYEATAQGPFNAMLLIPVGLTLVGLLLVLARDLMQRLLPNGLQGQGVESLLKDRTARIDVQYCHAPAVAQNVAVERDRLRVVHGRLGAAVRWRADEIKQWIAAGCPALPACDNNLTRKSRS